MTNIYTLTINGIKVMTTSNRELAYIYADYFFAGDFDIEIDTTVVSA